MTDETKEWQEKARRELKKIRESKMCGTGKFRWLLDFEEEVRAATGKSLEDLFFPKRKMRAAKRIAALMKKDKK